MHTKKYIDKGKSWTLFRDTEYLYNSIVFYKKSYKQNLIFN